MTENPAGGGLINFGDLSKPATTLIEKISDAIGGIAKPWQTVRVAKAEARADVIRAQAKIEISDVEQRALLRMVREEGKRQENIENITSKAIPHLEPDSKPEEVEDDWISHFFDRSRLISNSEMQSLWARMLAGEANKPGSYSRKTIDAVAVLDKNDANVFTKFCSLVWMTSRLVPVIFDFRAKELEKIGVNFDNLMHLDAIGLITFSSVIGYALNVLPKNILIHYYGRPLAIEFPNEDDNTLQIGHAMLTQVGSELAPICGSQSSDEYYMHVLSKWVDYGYFLSSPLKEAAT